MQAQNIVLVYRKENGAWQRKELAYGSHVIGRSAQADIQFDAPQLSRRHLEITVDSDGVSAIDLNSSNGSFFNGERMRAMSAQALTVEDVIKIGAFELKIEFQDSSSPQVFEEQSTAPRPPEPLERTMLDAPSGGFMVVYQSADGEQVEKELDPGTYVIGRTATADIQIPGTKVSRLHARLEVTPTGCSLEDVGSSNGTFYQGARLDAHVHVPLMAGAAFMVGDTELRVEQVRATGVAREFEVDATRLDELPKFPEADQGETELRGIEGEETQIDGLGAEATQIDAGKEESTQIEAAPVSNATFIESERVAAVDSDATAIEAGYSFDADRTSVDAGRVVEPVGDVSNGVVLKFRRDQGDWDKITMHPGEYVLGRSQEADVSMPDSKISRRHVKLTVNAAEGFSLMDLGSANGTLLNGMPLMPRISVPFGRDEVLSIGAYELMVEPVHGEDRTEIQIGKTEVGEVVVGATEVVSVASNPILRYREGYGGWNDLILMNGEQVMGRSSEAQLRIPSSKMSRRHARFFVQGNQVWLTDLNSKNGITMNGQRITPDQSIQLYAGARFSVDDLEFELVIGDAAPAGQGSSFAGNLGPVILEPGKLNMLLDMPAQAGGADATMIGAEMGIDMALLGGQQAQAPVNLAGHERVTIGRADDNMITFKHPLVSRYHAVIERMGTRTRITDLHSGNGVFINDQPVDGQGWLKPGDNIKIGPYLITFTGNELRPSTEQSYTIDVLGLQKWVTKDINLLKDISISIGQNEFVALVGMSGAGKSTLMDAINGFRPATHGRVYMNGTDLYENYNAFRDDIGNVPQKDIVHMELTGEQALEYAAKLRMPPDARREDRKAAVAETLEDLGLTYRKDVPIKRLSGGQLKRVSIGVELLTKPRLFFLDEPTSGLDPGTEYEMMKLLRRLADQGRTIMIITHATKNVMFCDKAIILASRGNLAFYGPPEDALQYFDQFRSERERLEKDMEFDDIYRILEDEAKGRPEDWRERYLQSPYARFTQPQAAIQRTEQKGRKKNKHSGKRISALRQFFILSSRYIRTMVQDKASLVLTLTLAPILGLMNFIWGRNLFDPIQGNAAKTMGVWFAVAIMGILVGYMGSIQELVKEQEIYKRERAVGLKILPYVMSKIWVGAFLGFYQAFFILIFTVILARPQVNQFTGYLVMYVTLWLVIFCSFIMGLLISAISPNPNTAQLIMIATFVPQILLSGVLQPLHMIVGGNIMSPAIVARWGFESFVNATGMGDDLVEDICWSGSTKEQRNDLTVEQKEDLCMCMGPQLFVNCGTVPGILSPDFFDEEAQAMLGAPRPQQPDEPNRLPTPTRRSTPTTLPSPTLLPSPTYLPTPTAWMTPTRKPYKIHVNPEDCDDGSGGWSQEQEDCINNQMYNEIAWQEYEQEEQLKIYQTTREAQFEDYRDDTENQFLDYRDEVEGQFDEYTDDVRDQIDQTIDEETIIMEEYADENLDIFNVYKDDMTEYSDDLSYYERTRQEAISSAEAVLGILWDDFGEAFKDKPRNFYIILITTVEFLLLLIFMKRKDTI